MSVIRREDTINYLMTNMNWHDEDGYTVEDAAEKRKIITELINGVPDADDGWIPCSKRLPKEHRKAWITTKWGEVTDGKRSCIPNIWFISAGSWNARDNEIIAWKPYSCQKPYESKESET